MHADERDVALDAVPAADGSIGVGVQVGVDAAATTVMARHNASASDHGPLCDADVGSLPVAREKVLASAVQVATAAAWACDDGMDDVHDKFKLKAVGCNVIAVGASGGGGADSGSVHTDVFEAQDVYCVLGTMMTWRAELLSQPRKDGKPAAFTMHEHGSCIALTCTDRMCAVQDVWVTSVRETRGVS